MVIHHYKKWREGIPARGGQRLMGNATLHGFVDSALYSEQMPPEDKRRKGMYWTRVEREFRSMAPQSALEVGLKLGTPGSLDMEVEVSQWNLQSHLEEHVERNGEMTVNQLAEALGIDKRTALMRCRGSEVLTVISGKAGRGNTHRVTYLNGVDHDA
jgi:hypothetical protein